MEELREIARLHYEAAPAEVKNRAVAFFNSMDRDGDGQINVQELWSFMSEQGHPSQLCNQKFFTLLDIDGDGGLNFEEVKTLFCIINSGRPCCAWCSQFIAGTFFSCPVCPFQLCPDCFKDAQPRNHHHDGRPTRFLDTFSFLQTLRSQNQNGSQPPTNPSPPVQALQQIANANPSTSILVHQRTSKREVAYKALILALAAAGTGVNCSIL